MFLTSEETIFDGWWKLRVRFKSSTGKEGGATKSWKEGMWGRELFSRSLFNSGVLFSSPARQSINHWIRIIWGGDERMELLHPNFLFISRQRICLLVPLVVVLFPSCKVFSIANSAPNVSLPASSQSFAVCLRRSNSSKLILQKVIDDEEREGHSCF